MYKIKFGTDGWRAIIAKDFTVENVARVAEATANWLVKASTNPARAGLSNARAIDNTVNASIPPLGGGGARSVVLGHDCRFGGELFAETVAKCMLAKGIKVHLAKGFVSTPMISLGTVIHAKADLGIIITEGATIRQITMGLS